MLVILSSVATFFIQRQVRVSFTQRPWGIIFPLLALVELVVMGYFNGKRRDLPAFFVSGAFIVGMLSSAAFSLYPYVLPAIDPANKPDYLQRLILTVWANSWMGLVDHWHDSSRHLLSCDLSPLLEQHQARGCARTLTFKRDMQLVVEPGRWSAENSQFVGRHRVADPLGGVGEDVSAVHFARHQFAKRAGIGHARKVGQHPATKAGFYNWGT